MPDSKGNILVVDDDMLNRTLISTNLEEQGYTVITVENGKAALAMLSEHVFDVMLLDLLMPEMDGFEVLRHIKANPRFTHIPVIVVSSLDEMESVVQCIEMGAIDHLPKPFDPILLRARVNASLAAKRLHDQEVEYLGIIQAEREKSEKLLLNILPRPIAERLKQGATIIADSFNAVTVLFSDIVGFTKLAAGVSPTELVILLNEIFSMFDGLAESCGLEKIKTIGDAYMVVGGLPLPRQDHADAVAKMALGMQSCLRQFNLAHKSSLHIRIGMHTGPVVAGIIGTTKFSYDLWGDTVNTASRMESHGIPDEIQVSLPTYQLLRSKFDLQERGKIEVKGKGEMETFLLKGIKSLEVQ